MTSKIAKTLVHLEKQLQIELEKVRAELDHTGNKGSSLEQSVRTFLGRFLPPTVRIGQGEVIDSFDRASGQLDVIITNRHHPPLNIDGAPSTYFIEGVSAIGEVKACLRHSDLDDAIASCAKFKSLEPFHPEGVTVYSNPEDLKRYVDRRPYFLFAFDSEITPHNLRHLLTSRYQKNGFPLTQQIDAVFLLGHGSVLNAGDATGNLKVHYGGKTAPGFHAISPDINGVLNMLLGWFHLVTPEVEYRHSPMIRYILPHNPDRKTSSNPSQGESAS